MAIKKFGSYYFDPAKIVAAQHLGTGEFDFEHFDIWIGEPGSDVIKVVLTEKEDIKKVLSILNQDPKE